MKKIIIFIIAISLAVVFSGCFDVERNNPFDPDSDLPSSEKLVTLKGHTYRGWSEQTLSNVKVEIAGHSTYSDSNGYYEIPVKPGTYTIKSSKKGWATESYQVSINASKNSSQLEDISMFIWYDYFDTYATNSPPPQANPWYYDVSSGATGSGMVLILDAVGYPEMNISLSSTDTGAYSRVDLDHIPTESADYSEVTTISLGLIFHNPTGAATEYYISYNDVSANNCVVIISNVATYGLQVYDPSGLIYSEATFTRWGELLFLDLYVDPADHYSAFFGMYDANGTNVIPFQAVSFPNEFIFSKVFFNLLFHPFGATKVEGDISVFSVNLY